ncbi:hypothetical protein [Halomonas sp. C05BenzN]|uniref:hypothetical protein n=1 Tax=Halomonas sp. C05BenzN TaxID=3411041 RepID=UPI003B94544E
MSNLQSRCIGSAAANEVCPIEGDLPGRVLIVNADCYRSPRVLDLLGLRNDHVVVCGQLTSMHRWGHYQHPQATLQCLVAPEEESATDTALVFHAGALLAQRPELRHVPWLVITQDQTLQALLSCLQSFRVRTLGYLPLHEGKPASVTAYKARGRHDAAEGEGVSDLRSVDSEEQGARSSAIGRELDQFIREQGLGYPVKGTRLRRAIDDNADALSESFHQALNETPGKTATATVRRLARLHGFATNTTQVISYLG